MESVVVLILEISALSLLIMGLLNVARNVSFMQKIKRLPYAAVTQPHVTILVPARNEAASIATCVHSLLSQTYPSFDVIVIDDDSNDATGAILDQIAHDDPRLQVLHWHDPLPVGWNGKSRACSRLADAARGEWLLFTDADTEHAPDALQTALTQAVGKGVSLYTGVPRQITATWGERLFVPVAYVLIFNGVDLPHYYGSTDAGITGAAAIGQFILVERNAYMTSGGHTAIMQQILDDVWLARSVKQHGYRILFADVAGFVTCRMYRGFRETWRGFSKNALAVLGGSLPAALVFTVVALFCFQLPLAALIASVFGGVPLMGFVIPLLMVAMTVANAILVCRLIGQPWWVGLLYPISMWIRLGILFNSVRWRYMKGGVVWKGRILSEK